MELLYTLYGFEGSERPRNMMILGQMVLVETLSRGQVYALM